MVPLKQLIGSPMDPARFVRIAIAASAALSSAHRAEPHGDVRPGTLLVDEGSGTAQLVGPAAEEGVAGQQSGRHAVAPEALPYMAPERTGRTSRAADHRTDLYSLGVVFYELLTGALPFQAEGVIEWVHCHIARRPRPISEHAPRLPAPIRDIVMKLLAKMPEDRYQTAAALGRDLARCLRALESGQELSSFPLGAGDVPEQLRIPHKLYGRHAEIASLSAAFDRVCCAAGAPELVLVVGNPGIGKSALVDELHRPVVRRHGLLVSGKADQYERGVPYAGIVQALDRFVQRMLMESKPRLAEWRRQLLHAVGDDGQIILDIVPRLERVIGPQPPVEPLPGSEAKGRFERVFRALFGAIASAEHPVVLFLDDLQWADAASLSFLVSLLSRGEIRHLLFIGAYRDNEVGAGHPLSAAIDEIQKAGVRTERVTLEPLSREDVAELVADALRCGAEEARPLAGLIHDKTHGNPFFATQFLKMLDQDGLVVFDPEQLVWRWDLAKIEAARLTDDVVEMVLHELRRLPETAMLPLRLAACIGGEFEMDTLAAVCEAPQAELHERLAPAVQSGLLLRSGGGYAFLHDRVQQAAYLLTPEAERADVHLRIARALKARSAELGDELFAIANQYNLGAAHISDPEERSAVAELNLAAGRRAKASSAYGVAAGYLTAGAALLDEASWRSDHELMLALHGELAECEHLSGNGAETRRLCALLLEHGRTRLDKQLAYRLLIERSTAELAIGEAIHACVDCMRMLGMDMPTSASDADVEAEFERIWAAIGDRPIASLADLPPMTDPEILGAVTVLSVTYVPAWYYDQTLAHWMMARTIYLSVLHGNAGPSAMSYATAAMVLMPRFGDYRRGYEFAKMGHELAHRTGTPYWQSMISAALGSYAAVWFEPFGRCVQYLEEGLSAGRRSGNVTFITVNSVQGLSLMISSGRRLDEVYRESERLLDITGGVERSMTAPIIVGMQRAIQCLRGLTASLSTMNGGGFEEEAFEQANPPSSLMAFYFYHGRKIQVRLLAGEVEEAVRLSERFKPFLWSMGCQALLAECTLYITLALLGHFDDVDEQKQREYRAEIAANEGLLAVWAENCPANYRAMKLLAGAEIARVERRADDALRLYDEAAESAREHGLAQIEALSKELAGRFCLARGLGSMAGALLRDARACYARWGADGKVRQLEQRYSRLLSADPARASAASGAQLDQMDVLTAVKTCQAISSEIDQDSLLSTLLRIVVEHAGAERCHFLAASGDALLIAASAEVGEEGVDVAVRSPRVALDAGRLPESMIQYVQRTHEQIILDDPAAQSLFSGDPYVARVRPRSVLCAPVLRQSALVGVLYLENNLTLGAFSARRLGLLQLITAQAAISMENAALYNALRLENAERRQTEGTLRESQERLRRLLEEREASAATLSEKLAIIERQQQAISSLSTPIIEVWDGVLTMPVLGDIDARTAAHMMEALLDAIVRKQSRHVIVDVTALQSVDSATADHLIRVVRAAKLLGSEGIIVGIRPEVAQTIVSIGLDLASVATHANLRQALLRCMIRDKMNGSPAPGPAVA
ncbi:AAA family ATPase [Sorangium sp. So ce296]|uniref:AAA family ATPase n=1 Tax=Sorangium sp. So ce296 TaxID=3133296 RepID=UPI003F624A44